MQPPIPEPSGALYGRVDSSAERKFRYKLWPVYWYMVFCIVICTPLSVIIAAPSLAVTRHYASYLPAIIIVTLIMVVAGLILSVVITLICIYGMPVRIGPDGINSYNAWGFPASLKWSQIQRVRPIRILWLRSFRLDIPDEKPVVWLPLYVTDLYGLTQAVRDFGGERNILVEYFDSMQI